MPMACWPRARHGELSQCRGGQDCRVERAGADNMRLQGARSKGVEKPVPQVTPESQPAPCAAADDIAPAPCLAYIPELDGIRAIAIGCVFLAHTMERHFCGGFIGVDLFFVLSGYLITTILFREHETKHRISLGRFYVRRALRLMPALAVMLTVVLLFVLLVHNHGHWGNRFAHDNAMAALAAALYL